MRGREPTFQRNLFRGTAADYDRYRPPYPAELGEWLATRLSLDGSGRLLDLASGTGHVARLLRPYFADIVAVDAEQDMVDYGRARSEREHDGIEWRTGRAEEIDFPDGSFEVVAAGGAFHRFDRPVVAAKAVRWLTAGGALALPGADGPWTGDAVWQRALNEVVAEWTDQTRVPAGWQRHDYPNDVVLREAGFTNLEKKQVTVGYTWTVDTVLGWLRSTSIASRDAMGARADSFEDAVRRALLEVDPRGRFEQDVSFAVELALR